MTVCSRVTILFEAPFWIGLFEHEIEGQYEVARYVFGAEPKVGEIYLFILGDYKKLHFVAGKQVEIKPKKLNPKKLKKKIATTVGEKYKGTKAQQALKEAHESQKITNKAQRKLLKEAEAEQKFLLKQAKRKEKHKGH